MAVGHGLAPGSTDFLRDRFGRGAAFVAGRFGIATTTLAPRAASNSAWARPMLGLPPAPVITATRPSKRSSLIALPAA
jgi:hypothetical protein